MFSPNVATRSGWFVIPGKLSDGRIVDLNRGGAPVSWAAPSWSPANFKNERRRKFLMTCRSPGMLNHRQISANISAGLGTRHMGKTSVLQSMQDVFVNSPYHGWISHNGLRTGCYPGRLTATPKIGSWAHRSFHWFLSGKKERLFKK